MIILIILAIVSGTLFISAALWEHITTAKQQKENNDE